MSMIMNAREVFEVARQIERNGENFYRKASAVAAPPEAKLILSKLAEMESEHEELFSDLQRKIPAKNEDEVPDLDMQALAYLRAMAEGKIFKSHENPTEKISGRESVEELFRLAIDYEKDSVVFFTGIREVVPENFGRRQIDRLIKEEMGHIAILSRELAVVLKDQK